MTIPVDGHTKVLLDKAIEKTEITLELLKLSSVSGEVHPSLSHTLHARRDWIENEHFGLLTLSAEDSTNAPADVLQVAGYLNEADPRQLSFDEDIFPQPQPLIRRDAAIEYINWANRGMSEWRCIALSTLKSVRALREREARWIERRECAA